MDQEQPKSSFNKTLSNISLCVLVAIALIASYGEVLQDPKHGLPATVLIFGTIVWIAFDFYELKVVDRGSGQKWRNDPSFWRTLVKMLLVFGSAFIALQFSNLAKMPPPVALIFLTIYLFGLLVNVYVAATS